MIREIKKIRFNEALMRNVVHAVNQAISVDVPQERRERRLETNNRYRGLSGDFINENLRKYAASDDIELFHFMRGGWEGCMLIDDTNSVTYTVMRYSTLRTTSGKDRKVPYYLQTILFMQNGQHEGSPKQITMADCFEGFTNTSFSEDAFEQDYELIMKGRIENAMEYEHYVVLYDSENSQITEIGLYLFDRDFAVVESINLMDYVAPDFAALTGITEYEKSETAETRKTGRGAELVNLKPQLIIKENA